MKLSDFKVGQKAYIYGKVYACDGTKTIVDEVTVVKVGRKYVTTTENPEWNIELDRFYVGNEENGYLNEQRECGGCRKLFASKEAMCDYETKENIVTYLKRTFFMNGGRKYSLEQLKKVMEILGGMEDD